MQTTVPARPDRFRALSAWTRGPLVLGLAGVLALTLWRVLLLPFDRADLFVDDAQYWLWSRDLDWGYFSKPPLMAWILRASTALGSDAPFWIRLPLPLIHAATAVVVMGLGRRLFDARVAAIAALIWASLPVVGVGSLLVSTDTPMLLFFALAMLLQLRLAERPSLPGALALGAAIGLGLLAKYAMLYFVLSATLAALVLPRARLRARDAAAAALVALAVVAPNLWWNATHGFATVGHTAGNAGWDEAELRPTALAEFVASQFAVAGPVMFAAYLLALGRASRGESAWTFLALMSLPALAIVSVQALIAGANANWAVAAHLGVALVAAAFLVNRPRWLGAGLAINLSLALLLPVAMAFADRLALPSGEPVFGRYLGRAEVSRQAASLARAEGLAVIVARDRDMLADLFYTLRDEELTIHAEPRPGPPAHHYAQAHPLPPGPGAVLYLTLSADRPTCRPGAPEPQALAGWRPGEGYYAGRSILAFRVSRTCWHAEG